MSFAPNLFLSNIKAKDGLARPNRFQVILPIPEYIGKFIDSVKDAFRGHGFGSVSQAGAEDEGGIFIVGLEGRIFTVDEDFHVGENIVNYMAEGSGGTIALGALHATKNQKNPKMRLKLALEAAAEFNMAVAPPFTYIQV